MTGGESDKNRVEFECSNGHKMSAGPKLFGQTRACPKCGESITIPYPSEDDDLDDIMEVLMGGDEPKKPAATKPITNFYRAPAAQADRKKQRRCHHCKKLNPANYRFCGYCKEQMTLAQN